MQCWSDQSEATLQDCFDHADWKMFQSASENDNDLYADSVSVFRNTCIGDVVPTVTVKTYPNQKLMDGGIHENPAHLTMERGLVIWLNINSVVIPSARQSNKQIVGTGTRWSRNSMAQT
jgi:hypothetical protein